MAVRDFPWAALERVPKNALPGSWAARAAAARAFAPEKLAPVLSGLVGADVAVDFEAFVNAGPPARLAETTLEANGTRVTIGADAALVFDLLERVLGRPFALKRAEALHEPELAGAYAALALETARGAANEPLALASRRVEGPGAFGVRAAVRVEGRPYAAYALVGCDPTLSDRRERIGLEALGGLTLSVPLVVGLSLIARSELGKLRVGAAFVPGEGLFIDRSGEGFGALAAAASEDGVRVALRSASGIVLGDETLALGPDLESSGDAMNEANDVNETLTDAVLEAPVVVRIELGSVSMTAGDWARLRPGDVIETGRRIAEPAVLRIGGRVVARGELVDVDGELGVRVRELASTPEP
ncbi:MAG TPA: FliM/FliN family flagellar motor switch protein [Polyangiaceae bacterium]